MGTGVEEIERTQDGNAGGRGDGAGTGTGAGAETKAVEGTGTRLRTGSGKAEERGRSATNSTRFVDAISQEGVGSVAPDPDNLENRKKAGIIGKHKKLKALVRIV